jgi:hypothetical protein
MKQIVISTLAITSAVFCLAASVPAHAARISGTECASGISTQHNPQTNQTSWCCRAAAAGPTRMVCTSFEKDVVYKPSVKTPAETKTRPETTK